MTISLITFDLGHTVMNERLDNEVPIERRPVHLMPGVDDALQRLTHSCALWASTRGTREKEVRAWLDRAGLERRFEWVITSVDAGCRKPAPEFFAYAYWEPRDG